MRIVLAAAVAALLALAPSARADDRGWTATDTALEASFVLSMAADWSQTMAIARARPVQVDASTVVVTEETNPFLGRRPSPARVTGWFAGLTALHVAVAPLLPRPWRTVFQVVPTVVELGYVGHNLGIGIGFSL